MTAPEAPLTAMLIYGTRPEAIKMAPLVKAMGEDPRFRPVVVVTGQERTLAGAAWPRSCASIPSPSSAALSTASRPLAACAARS